MREILFRAKEKHNKEWAYGFYVHCDGDDLIYSDEFLADCRAIDPDTVCRYIGLTDKNGTRIFESDIVTSVDFCPDNEGCAVIQWHDDSARYVIEADNILYDFDNYFSGELEVIGNIFDNPELIEEAAE